MSEISLRKDRKMKKTQKAFTLVELLVVISIIILLMSILVPLVGKLTRTGYKTKTLAVIGEFTTGINGYKKDKGFYPMQQEISSTTQLTAEAMKRLVRAKYVSSDGFKTREIKLTNDKKDYIPGKGWITLPGKTLSYPIDQYDDQLPILYYPARVGIAKSVKDPAKYYRFDCNKDMPECDEFKNSSNNTKQAFYNMLSIYNGNSVTGVYNPRSFILVSSGEDRRFYNARDDGTMQEAWSDNVVNFQRN